MQRSRSRSRSRSIDHALARYAQRLRRRAIRQIRRRRELLDIAEESPDGADRVTLLLIAQNLLARFPADRDRMALMELARGYCLPVIR